MLPWSPATSTTWLLVRISPSELMMMPDPEPAPSGPATLIFTTDGRTSWATCSTEPSAAGESPRSTTADAFGEDEEVSAPFGLHSCQAAAPATPAPAPTISEAVTTVAAKALRRRSGSLRGLVRRRRRHRSGVFAHVHEHRGRVCDLPETSLGVTEEAPKRV